MATDEMTSDDINEKQCVILYWRCDEGKGTLISDMSDNESHCHIQSASQWSEEPLDDGNPLDYEDKWGKNN